MSHSEQYPDLLRAKLESRPYSKATIEAVGRMCRVGRMSEETAVDFLDVMESDDRNIQLEAEQQFDNVFSPDFTRRQPPIEEFVQLRFLRVE